MHPHFRFATKLCRLLMIISIVLAGMPAQISAAADATHPRSTNEGVAAGPVTPTPEPVLEATSRSPDLPAPAPEGTTRSSEALAPPLEGTTGPSDSLTPALEETMASSDALIPAPETLPLPVQVRLEAEPNVADPGDLITYTLTLTNTGDAPLTDLLVNAAFVPELIYAPPDTARESLGQYYPSSYLLRYTLDALKAGETAVLTFQARLAQGAAGNLPCTAFVGADPTREAGATAIVWAGGMRTVSGADTGPSLDAGWKLLYNPPVVAAFSGAATYDYPLELPSGRNGLEPNLNLIYSSRAVDGTVYWVDSEWVGMGWSIDTIDIARRSVWYTYGAQGNYEWLDLSRDFSLVINGTSYRLTPATVNVTFYGRYYAENAPELYVELTTGSTSNYKGDYWIVRTPNGTRYRLGYNVDSEQKMWRVNCSPNTACWDDASPQEQVYRWRVDEVTDTFNNRMLFTYYEHAAYNREFASYPANIYYNSYGGGWASRVEFVSTPAGFDPGQFSPIFRTRRQLDGVRVYHLGQLVREYAFRYEIEVHANASVERKLTQVKQCGKDGAAGRCLPPTTFAYQDLYNKVWQLGGRPQSDLCDHNANPKWPFTDTSQCQYWGEQFPYPRLVRVDNGYGAVTAFSYSPEYTNGSEPQRYYAVSQAQTWDGAQYVFPNPAAPRTLYDYVGPCWDSPNQGCDIPIRETNALMGFSQTTERRQGYDGAAWQNLASTIHQFNTASYRTMGRETQTCWKDALDIVLQQTDRIWAATPVNNGYAYVGEERQTGFSGGTRTYTRVANTYDDYGNPIAAYQYGAEEPVVNAGFEQGADWWFTFPEQTPAGITTTVSFAGRGSLALQGASNGGVYQDIGGLTPGETYVVRAWVKASSGATAQFQIWLTDRVSDPFTPTTTWSQQTLSFVANAAGTVRIHLHYLANSRTTGTIYVDEVALARAQNVGDERSTHRFYFNLTNDNRWLIGLKWAENLFTGITLNVGGASLKTQTIWYYDDYSYDTSHWGQSAQISHGLVTMVGQGLLGRTDQPFVATHYNYDLGWGLRTSETNPNNSTTTTAYDGAYHLFTAEVCKAANAAERQCSQTEYYGVAGVPTDRGLAGQVKRSIDPNGVSTEHQYDVFGRLTKVARPGDSLELPTTEYKYREGKYPNGVHLSVATSQREQSTQAGTLDSEVFYDGQGRPIVARSEATDGKWAVSSTVYDGLGRKALEYVPQFHNLQVRVYEAEGNLFQHNIGSAQGNAWVSPNVTSNHGNVNLLSFGPGEVPVVAGPGQNVCFLLAIDVVAGSDPAHPIATLEVFDSTANQVMAQQDLKRGDFVGGLTNISEFCLAFDTTGRATHQLWYRVRWKDYAKMAHDRVIVYWDQRTTADAPYTFTMYDVLDRIVRVTAPDGTVTNTGYLGRTTIVEDANQHQRQSVVDAFGRLVTVREYADATGNPYTSMYAYNIQDNLTQITDAATTGHITTMTYDALGRMTELYDPDMGHWSYNYDGVGNVITQTNALSQTIVFAYDALNRLVRKQKAGGEVLAEYTYDDFDPRFHQYGRGRRTGMTDPSGRTNWLYDERGRVTRELKTIEGFGSFETSYTYDALSRVATMTYPGGETVVNHYDTQGLQDGLARSDGTSTYVENVDYNALGQRTLIEFGAADLNLRTDYTYNSRNARLESLVTTGPSGLLQNLTYTYDAVGNVRSITDGMNSGQVQNFSYDGLDRLLRAWTTGGGQGIYDESQTYDAIGNITEKDGATYVYDPNHPHAVRDLVNGPVGTYAYDANGNMTIRNDNGTVYMQSFDIENRLVSVTSGNATTTFVYDGDGKRVKKVENSGDTSIYVGDYYEASYPAPPGKLLTGRLTNVGSAWQTVQLPYRYNSMVVVASPSYDSGDAPAVVRVRYAIGNSFQIKVQNPSDQPLSGYTVHYLVVEVGVYTQAQHGVKMEAVKYNSTVTDRATSWGGQQRSYQQTYTNPVVLGQVMTSNDPDWSVFWARGSSQGNPPTASTLYTGKHIGEDTDVTRTNETIGYVVIEAGSGSLGGLAYIAALGPDNVSGMDNTPPFLYAISGPSESRVAVVSAAAMDGGDGGWPVLYGDDPVSSSQLKLVFDEDQIADAERGHSSEEVPYIVFSGARTLSSRDVVTKYYSAAGQRVAMRVVGSTDVVYYLHGDHLGSTSLVTTGNSVLVGGVPLRPGFQWSRQLYTPYGRTRWSQGASPTDRQFTGQRNETSLGLYDYNARFYDPFLGRFISADTVAPAPGNPQTLNRYSYALGNPLSYTDPSGHWAWIPILAVVGAIVTTATYIATTPAGERNVGEALLAAGIGAVAGTLIGTGIGVAAGLVWAGAAGSGTAVAGLVGGALAQTGVATVKVAEAYMIGNARSGESFDFSDLGNQAAWTVAGAVPKILGVEGPAGTAVSGGMSVLESLTEDVWNGAPMDPEKALGAGFSSVVQDVVGERTGLPVSDIFTVLDILRARPSDPIAREAYQAYLNNQLLQKANVWVE